VPECFLSPHDLADAAVHSYVCCVAGKNTETIETKLLQWFLPVYVCRPILWWGMTRQSAVQQAGGSSKELVGDGRIADADDGHCGTAGITGRRHRGGDAVQSQLT